MTLDCPGCRRRVDAAADVCDFCGYEFRPQLPPAEVKPQGGGFTAPLFALLGVGLIAGMFFNAEDFRRLGKGSAAQPAARRPEPEGVHEIVPANKSGPRDFNLAGTVFDVRSLKPVPGATLVFKVADQGLYFGAITDAAGGYSAWLPANASGYVLSIHHPGYTRAFVEDTIPSVRVFDQLQRAELAADLSREIAQEEHVYAAEGGRLRKDYAFVPK